MQTIQSDQLIDQNGKPMIDLRFQKQFLSLRPSDIAI